MVYLRCDFYADHYMESEIDEGYLKLLVYNSTEDDDSIANEIYLSKESVVDLVTQLLNQLDDIEQINKSSLI